MRTNGIIAQIDFSEILDCKVPGMTIDEISDKTRKLGYSFFCHNDRIFLAGDDGDVELTCVKVDRRCET